ncbi:MAG: phospho-N-acetylmuramoyl-pentapeptide-transferase [Anaerolineales bacterium]|nr:MAG: phospho-N-acetylmuramoyl-pentapeptide-transferase [Anaerolineales bacterium]
MKYEPSVVLVLAGITFILTVIWGNPLIRILRWLKVGDSIRLEMPNRHVSKIGTPTMGGVMFIVPVILVTGLMNAVTLLGLKPAGRSILLPLGVLVLFALLGAVDDREKLRRKEVGEGIRARYKILIQLVITAVIAYGLYAVLDVPHLYLPGFELVINLGWFYIPVAVFIIMASVNAINFTDGMDGLAGLIAATAFAAYGGIAILQEQIFLAQFCFILVGALFGFLWFNVHPAQLIMGDTGSEALGASLGVVALMTGHWLLLPIIAIIPVSEVLSVIIQVSYFKLTGGKRIFKMSPLHMHFELSGWSETQIVQRFWLVSLLFTMVGVALAVA